MTRSAVFTVRPSCPFFACSRRPTCCPRCWREGHSHERAARANRACTTGKHHFASSESLADISVRPPMIWQSVTRCSHTKPHFTTTHFLVGYCRNLSYPLLLAPVPLFEISVLIRNEICIMSRAYTHVRLHTSAAAGHAQGLHKQGRGWLPGTSQRIRLVPQIWAPPASKNVAHQSLSH